VVVTTLRVDPTQYEAASRVFGSDLAGTVGGAATKLESQLAGMSHIAGSDPAGSDWATSYDRVAGQTAQAIDDLERACVTVGGLLQQSGYNHARAEAHSDASGATAAPPDATTYLPGPGSCIYVPSVSGGAIQPPEGWQWVANACAAVWPDGDPDKLRALAGAWRQAGSSLDAGQQAVNDGIATIRTQRSPEVEQAQMVCRSLGSGITQLANACRTIADSCEALAAHIEKAHEELIGEIESFLIWTAGIEVGGAVVGAITFGIGEAAAQVGEGARIAALVARVLEIIDELMAAVKTLLATIGRVAIEAVSDTLKVILERVPVLAETRIAGAAVKGLDGLAQTLKLGGARVASKEEFDEWVSSLATRDAKYGSEDAQKFQADVTGSDKELKMTTSDGSTEIWADGAKYDPKTGGVAVEAKFVDTPGNSLYEGGRPQKITDMLLGGPGKFDGEMERYAEVINDPGNPVGRLDVVVSTQAAKDFLGQRLEGLAEQFAQKGLKFPYTIEVGP
jgi:hypothetical protein